MIERRIRLDPPEIDLATLAERDGLLDVAVARMDSPVGELLLARTPAGLVRVSFFAPEETMAELAGRISPRVLEAPNQLDDIRRQLDEYFGGRRRTFDVAVDWSLVSGFGRRVLDACARIPYGEVRTYGDMAVAAGNPKAFRAAGTALGHNPVPLVVPCHRVLRAGGGMGGYTGGLHIKEHLLRLEEALLA